MHETVEHLLKSLNSYKSAGSDGIPPCFLKSCRDVVTGPLTTIINQSLSTGVFKHAHVCPLPKHGDPTLASNYRPVSLLPVASKVLEKIVQKQLVQHFASFPEVEELPTEQFAYGRVLVSSRCGSESHVERRSILYTLWAEAEQ